MDRVIEIVPAIRRIELQHVGCWENLKLEFIPGINIITEERSAWGKTTIFKAILKALIPMSPMTQLGDFLSPTIGFEYGSITVELMSTIHKAELQTPCLNDFKHLKPRQELESMGEFMLRQLHFYLRKVTPNTSLLLENEVMAGLDNIQYNKAIKLLKSSRYQVICQIAHHPDLPKSFPKARIYACYEQEHDKVGMKLLSLRNPQL